MISKILLAHDGSEAADHAFEFALETAAKFSARLVVLTVARLPEPPEDVETEAVIESARERLDALGRRLEERALAARITPTLETRVGHPAQQIVAYAEENGVDLIVVGHRGHTLLARWLIGSVAKQVIIHAPCPVTVVR